MDGTLQQIGKRLYGRRKQLDMTQEELAEQANVTGQTISAAESGKKAMRADTIVRVCKALKISPDYLLLGDVTETDLYFLHGKVSHLTPGQYRCLEDIVDSFIAALAQKEDEA